MPFVFAILLRIVSAYARSFYFACKGTKNFPISVFLPYLFYTFVFRMEEKDNSHKAWAGEKKPSMKRRSEEQNYTERGLYMVTLAIEGRIPLLGVLKGNPDVKEGEDAPHVVLSPLGEKVRECWLAIQQYRPQIETMKLCIMPDHIHGILFVHEKIDCHLGHVIWGFKTGTRKAARELGLLSAAQLAQPTGQATPSTLAPSTPASSAFGPAASISSVPGPAASVPSASVPVPYAALNAQQKSPSRHTAAARAHGTLWEPGYNDRILLKKNQLHHWLAYLDDNPRRLLLKRCHPGFFSPLGHFSIAGAKMRAMGNIALLSHHNMRRLQCSRHLYPQEIDSLQQDFLAFGKDTFIISACISPGERQIATACIGAGIPFIVLLVHGFPPYYKPEPLYLTACAEGRLLLLSPFEWQNEKISNMRQRCLYLNDLALRMSEEANKGTLQITKE